MLERELPTGFEYIVNRFKIVEESSVPHESKFEAGFIVKVCDEDMFAKPARTNRGRSCKDGRQRSRKWTCERGGKAAGEKSRLSNFDEYYSPTVQS